MPIAHGGRQDNAPMVKGCVTFFWSGGCAATSSSIEEVGPGIAFDAAIDSASALVLSDQGTRPGAQRLRANSRLLRLISDWRRLAEQWGRIKRPGLAALARQLSDIVHKAGQPGLAKALFANLTPDETQVSQFVFGPQRRILRTRRFSPFV